MFTILFSTIHLYASSQRIINGNVVSTNDKKYESIVALDIYIEGNHALCAGTLISPTWVLTAAHCLVSVYSPNDVLVNTNTYDITNYTGMTSVKKFVVHPEYDPSMMLNDIALIELSTPITTVAPIALNTNTNLTSGENAWVAGWGNMSIDPNIYDLPDTLREALVPIVDFNTCNASNAYNGFLNNNAMLCAGYMSGDKDSCQGDSGGPLIVQENNQYALAGVVSFGGSQDQPCAAPNHPGVYTKVSSYVPWIKQYVDLTQTTTSQTTTTSALNIQDFNLNEWYLSGTTQEIRDLSIFNTISVLFIYQDNHFKAYSPDAQTRDLLKSKGYEILTYIPANSGFWIKK
jgi:secreted trypsin-like serine protease